MLNILGATLLALASFCVLEIVRVSLQSRIDARRVRRLRKRLVTRSRVGPTEADAASLLLASRRRSTQESLSFLARFEGLVSLLIVRARWPLGMNAMLGATLSLGLLLGGLSTVLGLPRNSIMAFVLLAAVTPWLILIQRASKITRQVEAQLPDALDMMARATQAGFSLGQSLSQCADEMPEPIATELRITANEIALGNDASRAFRRFAERVDSTDARYLALAVAVQEETGGSLIGTIRRLSSLIRQRFKLRSRFQSLLAGPRFTVRMLLLFPVFLISLLSANSPELLEPLWKEEAGRQLLLLCTGGIVTGVLSARFVARAR